MGQEEKKINILALQMSSKIGDVEFNRDKIRDLIGKNIKTDTDVIVLPEVWTVGWSCPNFHESSEWLEGSKTVGLLSELAKKYNVNIIGGSFIVKKADGVYANTCPVLNNLGELVGIYEKTHLFSYYGCNEGCYVKRGVNPTVVEINGVKIGLSICYDIRFPELYRAYRQAGADLMINMAAWPMTRKIHWQSLTTARAVENQCYFVALTQSGRLNDEEWNLGESRIIGYDGEVLSEILEGEGAISANLKFDKMYDFREKCTVLKDICDKYEVKHI